MWALALCWCHGWSHHHNLKQASRADTQTLVPALVSIQLLAAPLDLVRFEMPLSKEDKRALVFYLCIFFVFMQAGLHAGQRPTSPSSTPRTDSQWILPSFSQSQTVLREHPIPRLMSEAEENFKQMISRQSTTLKKAVAEYKRRYGRNPPKGFDHWWDFVQKHKVKIVDDYDAVFEDLAPFWDMSGEEFRTRVDVVRETPSTTSSSRWLTLLSRLEASRILILSKYGTASRTLLTSNLVLTRMMSVFGQRGSRG